MQKQKCSEWRQSATPRDALEAEPPLRESGRNLFALKETLANAAAVLSGLPVLEERAVAKQRRKH